MAHPIPLALTLNLPLMAPAEFPVGGVIKGWTEALQLMKVGAKYRLYVPHDLAYGEQGAGAAIAPYSTLIFDVELLDVLG